VRTEEGYLRRRPELIKVDHIAGPNVVVERYGLLAEHGPGVQVQAGADSIAKVNKMGERIGPSSSIAELLSHAQLALVVAPQDQLGELAPQIREAIRTIPLAESPDDRPFSNAGIHYIRRVPALVHRIKFASVALRLEYDELNGPGGNARLTESTPEAMTFASGFQLHDGMLMLDAYLAPLAGCLSPFVWGVVATRSSGNILVSLGRGLGGTLPVAAEPLQTLAQRGGLEAIPSPDLEPSSCSAAVDWWIAALNDLFGVLTDFAVFTDRDGFYNSSAHLQAMLSVEQLFRRVLSMQAAHRDGHARRVLLFTVLDTLERLTGRPLEAHCSLTFARKTLDHLRQVLPTDAAKVLLYRAASGVHALEAMQDGFFLTKGRSGVPVPDSNGDTRVLSLEAAVAHYIKVLRDATHGHGSTRPNQAARTNALLAHHDGRVPHDLGWIGFLYMLDFLSRPDALRSILRSRR
jgi:hypothetical protein